MVAVADTGTRERLFLGTLVVGWLSLVLCRTAVSATATAAAGGTTPKRRQLRWYVGDLNRVVDFLVQDNPNHKANTSVAVNTISGGVYQCCNSFHVEANGKLAPYAAQPPWNTTVWSSKAIFVSVAPRVNCSSSGNNLPGCSTPGDVCSAALARVDAFTAELVALMNAYQLKGINLDWEFGYGNNISCWQDLWGAVHKQLQPLGKEIAVSIDDSQGNPFDAAAQAWSYEWDWKYFLPFAANLINMGTYPGPWSKGISYPPTKYLEPKPCPKDPARMCGLKGQIVDLLNNGANASTGQLQLGVAMDSCSADGTTTRTGWTKDTLTSFLSFASEHGVKVVTIWTDDAMLLPSSLSTCAWFVPVLHQWATAQV